jgi:hypothetical protein
MLRNGALLELTLKFNVLCDFARNAALIGVYCKDTGLTKPV